jgi:transposase-like protein
MKIAEGKMCECNRCGEPMVITRYTLTSSGNKPQARPHCQICTKSRKQENVEALADFLSGNTDGNKT